MKGETAMLLGLDAQIWLALGFVLAVPVGVVGLLKLCLRRRGGLPAGWGAALVLFMAGCCSVAMILDKVA